LLLKTFVYQGCFPRQMHELPGAVIVHVARQVGVPAELYLRYEWLGRTIKYHRVQIREFLGFREATVRDGDQPIAWLVPEVLTQEHRGDHVRGAVFERCRSLRIESALSIG
jgi:hypothetical protein